MNKVCIAKHKEEKPSYKTHAPLYIKPEYIVNLRVIWQ
jgi:hypothetical protein